MKYQDLISKMTLEEKCSLLSGKGQFTTKEVARLGIPSMYLSDGPHGLRKQAGAADHLGLNESVKATCYPTAATMANSWDPELGEELGRHLGEECVAQRINVLLGPGLNMKRSPLCGRDFEYFSEDPVLAGKMAAAYIRGIQSAGVSACPKHFAVNNQELLRLHSDSVVDERTLREVYLTGFEIAVKEGKPKCIMSSYNRINGTYASENKMLLRDILVDEWGFEGFSVTDWGGSNDRVAGLVAGTHLEMPTTAGDSDRELAQAVREGRLSQDVLDERLDEYLTVLFDTVIPQGASETFDEEAHHAFARKAAQSTIVLLKNEGQLLPLKQGTRVAVIGDFALTPRFQGAGSSTVNPTKTEVPLDCLKAAGLDVVGFERGFKRHGGEDPQALEAACALAAKAEVALLYLGLDELSESEGQDRADMTLRPCQNKLVEAVAAVNPNVVVVLCGGSPVELPWMDSCKALLHGYLSGQAGALAMADVITGTVCPSGKLSESWPMAYSDVPNARIYPGLERTAEYREGPFIGYRYYATAGVKVRFPFGFGLSYTTFSYSDLVAEGSAVTFTITNTGAVAGAEVAQVYVSKPQSDLFRPALELKGFSKVFLQPGEKRTVSIPLDDKAFRYFNIKTHRWETEGGEYEILVGPSSAELPLTARVEVAGTDAPIPYERAKLPSYYSGQVDAVSDGEFEALLGRPIPPAKWDRSAPLDMNDTFSQLCYAKGWTGRLVYRILCSKKAKAEASGHPDLNILFIYNLPFRGVGKMMGSIVDQRMSAALLEIFNGHFFRGTGHLISAYFRKNKAAKATAAALAQAGAEEHR